MHEITVADLLGDREFRLALELLGGAGGTGNPIRAPRIQKPGMALAGYLQQVRPHRVQVFGTTEMDFLASLSVEQRRVRIDAVFGLDLACAVIANGAEVPREILDAAEREDVPLLRSAHPSSVFIDRVSRFLEDRLAPMTRVHGVLVDVMEVGILILGRSGIGKSECAMDLVLRGHRLVADDVVRIRHLPPFHLVGRGEELIRYHVEIRGVGILNIRDLFGVSAIRDEKDIELVVELVPWSEDEGYERLGFDEQTHSILDSDVPYLRIPVGPGRNVASIIEVAARNHLLKRMGHNSAIRLKARLASAMQGEEPS